MNNIKFETFEESLTPEIRKKFPTENYLVVYRGQELKHWTFKELAFMMNWDRGYQYKLIHKKHTLILHTYLSNISLGIEVYNQNNNPKHKWIDCYDFIESYDESFDYRIKMSGIFKFLAECGDRDELEEYRKEIPKKWGELSAIEKYPFVHQKHRFVLEAWVKNPNVSINLLIREYGLILGAKWETCTDFIGTYNENNIYSLDKEWA